MPHYDYKCNDDGCGFHVEDVQLPVDARDFPTTEPCPNCDKMTIEKVISAPGVSYTTGSLRHKTPETFKDILRNIKAHHRGSTIDV